MAIANDADINSIQEPWIGDTCQTIDRTRFAQTISHAGYDSLFKETTDGIKTRVIWMVRKDQGIRVSIRDALWDDPDMSVIDI